MREHLWQKRVKAQVACLKFREQLEKWTRQSQSFGGLVGTCQAWAPLVTPQIALVLDRQRLRDEEHEAELLAQSERLGKTLLNSVLHELRTPLAAISTVASGLPNPAARSLQRSSTRRGTERSSHSIEPTSANLLDLSRLEAGHLHPNLDWHDARDVWKQGHEDHTHYLRVYIAHLREKIEADPSRPQLITTEPGVGYRLLEG